MPKGSCDPGPGLLNETVLSKANGRCTITVRWSWDGVSVWPGCDGPIVDVTFRNTSPHAWLATFPAGRATRTRAVPAGMDRVFSGAILTTIGLVNISDASGLGMIDTTVPS